jgi:hypothetical protein
VQRINVDAACGASTWILLEVRVATCISLVLQGADRYVAAGPYSSGTGPNHRAHLNSKKRYGLGRGDLSYLGVIADQQSMFTATEDATK